MSLLNLSEVSFHYSSDAVLFEGASFPVNPGDRIAIVGANGAGKSTLLLLLAGLLEPAAGTLTRRRALAISMAGQESGEGGESLFEFILDGRHQVSELRARLREIEPLAADARAAAEYADRIHEYAELGGYLAEAEAERMLSGLGFAAADFERELATLSGGERTRASLARALSTPSDLLILDEPTNHLDIAGREWLEDTLAARPGAVVLTSHDRALLCAFARKIVEIDRGQVRVFEGTYEEYRHARALLDRQAWAAYDAFQRRKRAAESAARRRDQLAAKVAATPAGVRAGGARPFYNRKAAKVARTARILRERVGEEKAVEKPWEESPIDGLTFDHVARGGDVAVIANGLTKTYGSRTLFRDLSFHIRRGERLIIAGANGSGKTTLLMVIAGRVPPDAGTVRYGAHVQPALISQTLDTLDPRATPLAICGTDTRARTLLACLKLRPDCLNRPVSELSGGERTKVALAQMLTSGANLLLLDEPTNHLEIEAQEALETALRNYPGAAIVVSHDRFFLDALGEDVPCVRLG